jgi:hypothetical protein
MKFHFQTEMRNYNGLKVWYLVAEIKASLMVDENKVRASLVVG